MEKLGFGLYNHLDSLVVDRVLLQMDFIWVRKNSSLWDKACTGYPQPEFTSHFENSALHRREQTDESLSLRDNEFTTTGTEAEHPRKQRRKKKSAGGVRGREVKLGAKGRGRQGNKRRPGRVAEDTPSY